MADSSRVRLIAKAESSYGADPGGTGWTHIRHNNETMAGTAGSTRSEEIRSNRVVANIIRNDVGAAGDVSAELTYSAHDLFFTNVMQSSYGIVGGETSGVAVNASLQFELAGGWTGASVAVVVGDWVRTTGFTTAGNNVIRKVTATDATTITVDGPALVQEAADAAQKITVSATMLNGSTLTTLHLQREYQDLSNMFAQYPGANITGANISASRGGIASVTFNVIASHEVSASASAASGIDAVNTDEPFSPVNSSSLVREAGASYDVQNWGIEIVNGIRLKGRMYQLGATGIGNGRMVVTGSHGAYFETAAVMDKFLNDTASSWAVAQMDADGNVFVIDVPRLKYTGGTRFGGGNDTDILANMTWEAEQDATDAAFLRFAKIPAFA